MKKDFSKSWNSSKNRRKQRKYTANAPLHIKGKFLSSHLSKQLIQKYGTRSVRIRKGDKVKIMAGQHKGKTGSLEKVSTRNTRVTIDSLFTSKKDGSKSYYPVHPSNLQVQELNLEDRKRKQKIESLTKGNKK
ncbi:MAG: 50S ribosomal protein L24 [Nanoarchaeota archaeon]|nr:50S ribosomal protein L24 [Nanoarchaeota archaeon]